MILNKQDVDYLAKIQKALDEDKPLAHRVIKDGPDGSLIEEILINVRNPVDCSECDETINYCSECGETISRYDNDLYHVMMEGPGGLFIAIMCGGYYAIEI